MLDRLFIDILERSREAMQAPGDLSLYRSICHRLGVKNVAYMGLNLPKKTNRSYFVHNTYSADWAMRYETENYVSIDPIIRLGLTGIMPFDWSDMGKHNVAQRKFFGEAVEFGVGTNGLSFPLRGLYNETAVFSVSADFSAKEWQRFKREHLREMRVIADLIHQDVVGDSIGKELRDEQQLTDREMECLRWYAEGKTYQDISDLLGISARTVRFFLESARHKLNCLNTTHTVVVALSRGLI